MHTPYTFIIIGRSGSGKGTQLSLLKNHIESKADGFGIQSYNCGDAFRAFFKEETPLSNLVKDSVNQGNYQPDFLATTLLFRDQIFKTINNTDHLFFDGYPRSTRQLQELTDLLKYVGQKKAIVLDIVVSADEVTNRMMLRKRSDDTQEGIAKRQNEFTRAIVPMIEAIKKDTFYTYLAVDGMGAVSDIHQRVLEAINPYITYGA